jgi:hypothetical protein
MPKIPTFTTQARPTAEVGSIRSNIQIDPTKTMAAGLAVVATAAQDYYVKQRDNVEKLEAKKKFYEMKAEENKIIEKLKNNADEFGAVDIYNNEFGNYKNAQISGIQNRRIKKKVEELFGLDQPETIYKIKKNSFETYEKQENEVYNTDQNIFASEYSLETDEKLKELTKQKRLNSAKEYESKMMKGKEWLSKELKKIETDSVIFNADKAISNKDYGTALNILKSADKSKIDSEELQKKLLQIEKEGSEYKETSFHINNMLQGTNTTIGAAFKSSSETKVKQGLERVLFNEATKNNLTPELTFSYVDRTFAKNGEISPTYKDLMENGYNTGSIADFDSEADIPSTLIQAVKAAESAEKLGRLNLYTSKEQERFYKNIVVLKQIQGLDNYQAIKQAKEFEKNYDANILKGSGKQRGKTLTKIETKFKDSKSTNINEVRGYAGQLYDMYIMLGVGDEKAKNQVVKDMDKNIIEVDNHSYLKRDIVPFQVIDGIENIPVYKEYIIKNNLPEDEDADDYYLRHNGGGQFEIRRRVDLAPVLNKDNKAMIFYAKDLLEIKKNQTEEFKKDIIKQQAKMQKGSLFALEQQETTP